MNKLKKIMAYVLVPLLLFAVTEIFYLIWNYDQRAGMVFQSNLLCLLMITFLYWLFIAATNNSRTAAIIMSAFVFVFTFINQVKIALLSSTFMVSDLKHLGSIWKDICEKDVGHMLVTYLPFTLLLAASLAGICFLAHMTKSDAFNTRVRIITGVSVVLFYILLFIPVPALNNFMTDFFFQKSVRADEGRMANSQMKYYYKYGVFSGMYGMMLDDRLVIPEDYSDDELEAQLEWADKNVKNDGSWGTPNIIMVFSESFTDIGKVPDIQFDKTVTPNYERLKKDNICFNMITPSFGALSANVEFEMETGGNMGYFTTGYAPFVQLYTNNEYYDSPSIFSELSNNGYRTKVVSTWEKKLFDVDNVYKYFGIDEPLYLDDLEGYTDKGDRISDESVTDHIIEEFDNKQAGEKLFYMVLTAQAHFPYPANKYDNYDVSVVNSDLSDEKNDIIRCYAQGIYDADKQLGRLYDYIQTLDEPTIIIFYGDHLPFLDTEDGYNIYKDFKYFNTDDEVVNDFRKYNTECLILANYELKDDGTKYLGPDLVMSYVFNKMDMKVSPYFKWLYSTKDTMASMNWFVTMDGQGNLYKTSDLPDNIQKMYDLRFSMHWKQLVLGR